MQNLPRKNYFAQSGQALVLVLLSLSVVLTIVLFVLARSVTDISLSSQQADSVRAFSAAEAGIERALILGQGFGPTDIGDATFSVEVADYSEGLPIFNYPVPISAGGEMINWFVSHNEDGTLDCSIGPCFTGNTLKVCWGNPGAEADPDAGTTPAIEVSIYYNNNPALSDFSSVRIARATFDPNSARASSSEFSLPDAGTCKIGDVPYAFQKTFTMESLNIPIGVYSVENGLIFARIRMVYNTDEAHLAGTSVDFDGNTTFPSQGFQAISTGTAGPDEDESNRRISVFQGWPQFPFSGTSLFTPSGVVK